MLGILENKAPIAASRSDHCSPLMHSQKIPEGDENMLEIAIALSWQKEAE